MTRDAVTRALRVVPGVFLLRPTNRGTPAVTTRADGGDIAVLDGGERRRLRAAVGRVDQHDVGGLAGGEQAAVEAVDAALLPVAAQMKRSGGMSVRLARWAMV